MVRGSYVRTGGNKSEGLHPVTLGNTKCNTPISLTGIQKNKQFSQKILASIRTHPRLGFYPKEDGATDVNWRHSRGKGTKPDPPVVKNYCLQSDVIRCVAPLPRTVEAQRRFLGIKTFFCQGVRNESVCSHRLK